MKDFNNKPRFGGNDRGGRPSFGGKPSFNRGSDRGFDRDRQMHSAKCGDCGKTCEVPFRPTGERPVYCNDCFGGKSDDRGAAFGKRDSAPRSYDKPSYEKPAYAKPAYAAPAAPDARIDELKRQLESVNTKLDKLIQSMGATKPAAPVAKAVAVEAPKKAEKPAKKVVAKVAPKTAPKTAVKKVAAKKKK